MYANVIIDVSIKQLDRPFTYHIPKQLESAVHKGVWVEVPFGRGNTLRKGLVIDTAETAAICADCVKDIAAVAETGISVEETMLSLAVFISQEYGGTLIQAVKTVMPVKSRVKHAEKKYIVRTENEESFKQYLALSEKKNWKARKRLLEYLAVKGQIELGYARSALNITADTIQALKKDCIAEVVSEVRYRNTISHSNAEAVQHVLNEQQKNAAEGIINSFRNHDTAPVLIHGITGSGKTEIYMQVIEAVVNDGKQVIVLIPEISLTYQVTMRFYARFGSRVTMVNSKLSPGERFDQFERARKGEVSIMIGPRSALFTPFEKLGMIIMDEEQEAAYISENVPRYNTRETALKLSQLTGAMLVMGSATPSVEAYTMAINGKCRLYSLTKRAAQGSQLAQVSVADMRRELAEGNRTVFSRELKKRMEECLAAGHQLMLFINRRGFSRAVSCRACGKPVKCPHCDVSLTLHINSVLKCHYCGYTVPMPKSCPSCGSPYLAGFGLGTQKAELLVKHEFPTARVLRMDADTTVKKGSYEEILEAFHNHEADILVGTQMIVKGHDFPDVALVGILAADISLYSPDFKSNEKTFDLITQAAGRAGRSDIEAHVVVQTYDPDNYSIDAASKQDYQLFYRQEISFRKRLSYPPCGYMCEILAAAEKEEAAWSWIKYIEMLLKRTFHAIIFLIGPSDAPIARISDMWRKQLYFRTADHAVYERAVMLINECCEKALKDKVYIYINKQ